MFPGSSHTSGNIIIPYNLAYGERGNRNIPPYSTLVFKVELLNIKEK